MRGPASSHHHSSSSIYYADNDRRSNVDGDANSVKSEHLGKTVKMNHFLLPGFLLELAILACLAVFAYYLRFTSVFKGHHRLISCQESNLFYPYQKYTPEIEDNVVIYVDDKIFYSVSFVLPVVLIILAEITFWALSSPSDRKVVSTLSSSLRIPLVLRRIVRFVGTFWMGALIVSILTDSTKLLSGRPRPYFLTVCNVTCTKPFITANECSNTSEDLRDAQLSFPSYYACVSSFAAAFSVCYVQVMANIHGNYFLRPMLFACFSGMSLLAGFTRWMLYKNHWEDLLIGYIIGSLFAIYISRVILHGFREYDPNRYNVNQTIQEARPGFLSWFALPRIPVKSKSGRGPFSPTVYINGNTGDATNTSMGPNLAFQKDLHRRVEDFSRKNMTSSSGGGGGGSGSGTIDY